MKRLLLVLTAFVVAGPAFGQPAVLSGRVTDAETGEPLPRANVVLAGTAEGAATDADGSYELTGVPPGRHTVIASYLGHRTHREVLTLSAGETRRLDFVLSPAELRVGEVVVTTERGAGAEGLSVVRLDPEAVEALPTVLEPDLFRALQLLPGIQAASDFSSGLYIRGGSPDQTLVLLDGAPIYNPSHVFGFFSTFNPDAVGEVQVYKGGYPSVYGGRLGAVVDITTRTGSREAVSSRFSAGLLASRAAAEGPLGQEGSWMLAVRRSTLEPLLYALNGAGVDGLPERFSFYDVNGKVAFSASPRDEIALSVYAGRDRLDYPFLDEARFDVAYGNHALSLSWAHLASERLSTRFSYTATRYFSRPVAEIGGTVFEQANSVLDAALQGSLTWALADAHVLGAGLRAGTFRSRLENRFDGRVTLSPRLQAEHLSAYAQDTYRLSAGWEATAGLRASYYARGGHLRLAPRLAVEHRLAERVRLQAAYGRYYQHLTLVSSSLASAFDVWLTTADDVPPAYGDQLVAGLETRLASGVTLDVEGYYRTMRALFEIDPRLADAAGLPYAEVFHFGEGYAYGAEVLLRKPSGRLSGFLSYAYGWTRRRFEGFEESAYYPPKYDRRHDLSLVLSYGLTPSWSLTGVFVYGSGQAYTEPTAQYRFYDNTLVGQRTLTVLASDFNAARLPPYHRLDLGLEKTGRFFGLADYTLNLQLVNTYGRRNVWFYFFESEDDSTVTRSEVPQIPIPLPNVSLTLEF